MLSDWAQLAWQNADHLSQTDPPPPMAVAVVPGTVVAFAPAQLLSF